MTATRLIAYAPNGASLGPLPTPLGVQASYVLNDVGALSLEYHPEAARASLLGQPLEVATEVSYDQGMTWQEPLNGRFLYLRDERDPIKTEDAFKVSAPSYAWRLQKALVGTAGLDDEGKRPYATQTPGAILLDLFQRAQGRGALTGMTATWTAAADSNGTPWPEAQTISYDPGAHLLSILQGMADDGWLDFATQGRDLLLYVPESTSGLGRDRTTIATPVVLRFGRDLTEAPFRRTWEGLADTAVVLGDEGKTVTRINPAAQKPWGVQETFVTASGVADDGTLSVLGDAALTYTEQARAEHTLGLEFAAAVHLPHRDYRPGDWVYASTTGTEAPARMRVRAITLTRGDEGQTGGNVTLNDRFLEADLLQNRRVQRVLNGATQTGGGGTPSGIGPDILAPGKPVGLAASSAAYVTPQGFVEAQVSLQWNNVTTNADNTPTNDVAGYEVWGRVPGQNDWRLLAETIDSEWYASGFHSGETWEFKVRAVDTSGNLGAFSEPASTTTAFDLTPPPEPSAPTAESRLGTARVSWDGRTVGGSDMNATVPDWRIVEVHVSTVTNFTPSAITRVGELDGPGYVVAGPLAYQSTYYARLVALDSSGNASTASAQVAIVVKPLVDVSNFPDSAMTELYARTGKFLDLSADNFAANLIEGAWVKAGAITADKISLSAQAQSVVRNSWMEDEAKDASGVGLGYPLGWGVWYGDGTTLSFSPTPISGSRSLRITAPAGINPTVGVGNGVEWLPVVGGQKWFARVNFRPAQAIPAGKDFLLRLAFARSPAIPQSIFTPDATWPGIVLNGPLNAGQVYTLETTATVPDGFTMGAVDVGFSGLDSAPCSYDVDGLEMFPATTDAQITDITPGKIVTGILQATTRIVAGSLTGARAELNGVGFQAFASDGRKMFEVQANSGDTYVGSTDGVHMMLGAYQNWWNGNVSSAMLKFRAPGWGEGNLFSQYWSPGDGHAYGALRLQAPYQGDPYANAAYLDLRGRSDGYSLAYLRANQVEMTANTFIMGDSAGSSNDFRAVHANGFQFSDFSQVSRLRLIPQAGFFTVRSGRSDGTAQPLILQGEHVRLSFGGFEIYAYQPVGSGNFGLGNPGRNVMLSWGSERLRVTAFADDVFLPITASEFNTPSDPRLKDNATKATGALDALRAVPVYDYDMRGALPRVAKPRPAYHGIGPSALPAANRTRGVMADDLRAVLPDAVHEDDEGGLSVNLYSLLASTLAGLQDLAAQVDTLKATQPPKK